MLYFEVPLIKSNLIMHVSDSHFDNTRSEYSKVLRERSLIYIQLLKHISNFSHNDKNFNFQYSLVSFISVFVHYLPLLVLYQTETCIINCDIQNKGCMGHFTPSPQLETLRACSYGGKLSRLARKHFDKPNSFALFICRNVIPLTG